MNISHSKILKEFLLINTHSLYRKYSNKSNDLDEELRIEQGDVGIDDINGATGLIHNSLGGNFLSLFVGFSLFLVVFLDASQELGSAGRKP